MLLSATQLCVILVVIKLFWALFSEVNLVLTEIYKSLLDIKINDLRSSGESINFN